MIYRDHRFTADGTLRPAKKHYTDRMFKRDMRRLAEACDAIRALELLTRESRILSALLELEEAANSARLTHAAGARFKEHEACGGKDCVGCKWIGVVRA